MRDASGLEEKPKIDDIFLIVQISSGRACATTATRFVRGVIYPKERAHMVEMVDGGPLHCTSMGASANRMTHDARASTPSICRLHRRVEHAFQEQFEFLIKGARPRDKNKIITKAPVYIYFIIWILTVKIRLLVI